MVARIFLLLAVSCQVLALIQGLSSHSCLVAGLRENMISVDEMRCTDTFNHDACVVKDRQSLIHKFGHHIGNILPVEERDMVCGSGKEAAQCLYLDVNKANDIVISWAEWSGTHPNRIRVASITDGVHTLNCSHIWMQEFLRSCVDAPRSGVYTFYISNTVMNISCLVDSTGAWSVIQSRVDGTVNFYRSKQEYRNFFGDLEGNFWLGLDNIHKLSGSGQNRLRIDLEYPTERGTVYYRNFGTYSSFSRDRLFVEGYEGSAEIGDSMAQHHDMLFSARDEDRDVSNKHCAQEYKGGWWYSNCYVSNLNGVYGQNNPTGIIWQTWKGDQVSLKSVKMMVKRP